MTKAWRVRLYVLGAVLMALPGLFTAETSLYSTAVMAAGCVLLLVVCVKHEFTAPRTALLLLLVSNVSFWLSYALWTLRPTIVGPPPTEGIDPFAGPVALWLLLFLVFSVYETVVFVLGVTKNRQRGVAVAGLVAAGVQVLVTMQTIYAMIEGV